MIYVGIDIAKLNHFASTMSSDGEELIRPFKFTNDNDGFQLLISKLDLLDKDSLIICLESTAHYGNNLVLRFVTFYDLDLKNLKALGRFRQETIKQRTRLKIQLTSYVEEIFPELQYFFKSDLH